MQIFLSRQFQKSLRRLPKDVCQKIDDYLWFLSQDIQHPTLHTKKLRGEDNFYSFRIGREYRCLFMFTSEGAIHVLDVGHRKDIYR